MPAAVVGPCPRRAASRTLGDPVLPFAAAEVAQLVEHGSEKPGVDSSILSLGTMPSGQ